MDKLYLMVLLGVLVSAIGCSPSADSLVQRQIGELNELADALEGGADQAKLDAIGERMKETKTALDNLDIPAAEKKRLAEKYAKPASEALARVAKASMSKMGGMMEGMMQGFQGGAQGFPQGFPKPPKLP